MKKRLILTILSLCLLLTLLPVAALADDQTTPSDHTRAENQCGENVFWSYSDGTLTISGSGEMDDMYEYVPWDIYRNEITAIVFEGEVSYIGAHSFTDYDALTTVDFGDALVEIGYEAFRSCDGLTVIELPKTFRVFGEESFQSCSKLTQIRCNGSFPSFRQNCLWDTYADIIFPAERPWSVEYIKQLEEAFHGRIEFLASDGTDPYVPEEPTQPETTESVTQETTENVTESTTEAQTQPETTENVTEAEVESESVTETPSESSAPETTGEPSLPAQTEPEEAEESGSGVWVVIAVVLVAIFLLSALLSILGGRKKSKKSRGGKYASRR